MNLADLKKKSVAELLKIAEELGLENLARLRKQDIIFSILKAKAARGDHPITPLAFYGDLEVLEGPAMEGAVILQFPDVESARAWYYSPAYQEAMQHRVKGADWRAFIVKGVA